MYTQDVIDRFNSKWEEDENGCWIWTAGLYQKTGYGQFKALGIGRRAHRFAWEIEHGPIRDGLFICHHCDQPSCVRISHLFIGTPADNSADMVRKGRSYKHEGAAHGMAVLTEDDAIHIYTSKESGATMAREYGITPGAVSMIRSRKRWSHIHPIKRRP